MHRPQRRKFPVFNFPQPRFREQYDQMVKLALIAEKMHALGTRIDTQRALTHAREADKRAEFFSDLFLELTGLDRKTLGEAGEGGTKAVKDWFRDAGAPAVVTDKNTKQLKFGTDKDSLGCWAHDYAKEAFAPAAAALLGLRKNKTSARFSRSYYEVATQYGGRIHFDFNVLGAKTGRWSSSAKFRWKGKNGETVKYSLNAQQIPKAAKNYDFGKHGVHALSVSLRDCIIPDDGCSLITCDYEGAEAYTIAYNTQEPMMLEWVSKGWDFHTQNAKIMFQEAGIPADLVKIEKGSPFMPYREATKAGGYGMFYTAERQQNPKEEARPSALNPTLWKAWKEKFPNMPEEYFGVCMGRFWTAHAHSRQWQRDVEAQVMEDGFTALDVNGKTLYFAPTKKGVDRALNFPNQGAIGGLINQAVIDLDPHCDWRAGGFNIGLQVHDELVCQAPNNRLAEVCPLICEIMGKPAVFGGHLGSVPVSPDVGPNWGACKPFKS